MWRNAGTSARAAGRRVRRSHIRIGAVIDIEKSALCAFEKDSLPALQRAMEIHHGIRNERLQFPSGRQITLVHLSITNGRRPERLENTVVLANFRLELL